MDTHETHEVQAGVRPLPVLRAMVDAIDREILQLLARRYSLVADIAVHKRAHHLPIRDLPREREILSDRRGRGERLGLSPELVESFWRLILWASRDRQAALRAEVPPDIEPRTVAVIGGRGAMGGCFAQMFGDLGHAVMVADLETTLTPEEAVEAAEVAVISVPIEATEGVIRSLGPRVRADGLLMDVTSLKAGPMRAMLESTAASVVGTHPLFGPSVHSLQGQRVVLTPGRGEEWLEWVRGMLRARGLVLVETTPEEHDRTMAVVQVLVHYATEVMGAALARLGLPLEETLRFTSPVYLLDLLLTARHFAQSPELYAAIHLLNPAAGEVTAAFVAAAEELRAAAAAGDRAAFETLFGRVRAYFGEFTGRALEQSDFLIDRVVERA
ncbi:MAG: bifunctional chorismate mutase/prephenate dehydrogenase [Planctomycetota bacterium]